MWFRSVLPVTSALQTGDAYYNNGSPMAIFFYQSFESGNSPEHGAQSFTARQHTITTHQTWAGNNASGTGALVYPLPSQSVLDRDNGHMIAIKGPPNMVDTAGKTAMHSGYSSDSFVELMQNKMLNNNQALIRQFGRTADVTAFGELDGNHGDLNWMPSHVGPLIGASDNAKACQNFTVFANNMGNITVLGASIGWYAIRYLNITVVFVHVPNARAGSLTRQTLFYKEIKNTIGDVDLVMGDTNQGGKAITAQAVTAAFGSRYVDAFPGNKISPIDAEGIQLIGTNSTATKMYDVAVYREETIKFKSVSYLTQQAKMPGAQIAHVVASTTDHMGLAVEVERL